MPGIIFVVVAMSPLLTLKPRKCYQSFRSNFATDSTVNLGIMGRLGLLSRLQSLKGTRGTGPIVLGTNTKYQELFSEAKHMVQEQWGENSAGCSLLRCRFE